MLNHCMTEEGDRVYEIVDKCLRAPFNVFETLLSNVRQIAYCNMQNFGVPENKPSHLNHEMVTVTDIQSCRQQGAQIALEHSSYWFLSKLK